MKSNFSEVTISRILSVDFFSECGNFSNTTKNELYYPVNKETAEELVISDKWEYYTQEQAGELTAFLHKKNSEELTKYWNIYVKNFNEFWESNIRDKVLLNIESINFNKDLIHTVQWDLLNFTMRQSFIEYNPPSFYENLFLIYESGHLPCGVNDFSNFNNPKILIY